MIMEFIPNNITKEHVLNAIKKIESENIDLIPSTRWLVEFNSKSYPPKEVMRYAHEQLNGEKIWNRSGGEPTNKYLKEFGFKIIDMLENVNTEGENLIKRIIEKYKARIKETRLAEELFKWQRAKLYEGRPDVNAEDFYEEIYSMDFSQLFFHTGISVSRHIAKERPEEFKEAFRVLQDGSQDLQERISYFTKETLRIYKTIHDQSGHSHHQDERSMSTYLAYFDANQYPFYKASFYKKYCAILGIKPAKTGLRYLHYIALLKDLIKNHIETDTELLQLKIELLDDNCHEDANHLILAQDILYQMVDKGRLEETEVEEDQNEKVFLRALEVYKKEDLVTFFQILEDQLISLDVKLSDERVVYSCKRNNRLAFIIGQRYCLDLRPKENLWGFITLNKIEDPGATKSEPYDGKPIAYYSRSKIVNIVRKHITEMNLAFFKELQRTEKSGFLINSNPFFEKAVFDPAYRKKILSKIFGENNKTKKIDEMNYPLNTILYGPPGTGKTYRLKNEFFDKFTTKEIEVTRTEYLENKIKKLSWWEIIALAVLELGKTKVPSIFNHELVQIKAKNSNSTTVTPTIWGQLQSHTIDECEFVNVKKRSTIQIFNKTQNSEWEILTDRVEEQIPELLKIKEEIDNFKPSKKTKKRYVFTTFHQSFSYEDFIEGIKPIIYEDEQNPEKGKQIIYDIKPGLFKQIVKEAKDDRDNDYAIFIDEINRGNIANIFGELITLIEDDKRIDTPNFIPARLPYSNEDFGVPPNLYIIGTMNTADRSVEALDTALRRRFSFIEMNPEPTKLSSPEFKCAGIDLEALLKAINARIEKLLDKDYCIGHSYFMTIKNHNEPLEEIKLIFQNKILPLLQEYFYGDWGKILLVIGKEFVETKEETIKFMSTESYEDFEEYEDKKIYNFTTPLNWTLDSFKTIYE